MEIAETDAAMPAQKARRKLAGLAVVTGILTVLVGLGTFLIGMGLANVSASGSGAAMVFVGVWTMLAARNLSRNRLATVVCLTLAWTWLVGRFAWDASGIVSTLVIVIFALAAVGIPLALAWLATAIALAIGLVRRLYKGRSELKLTSADRGALAGPALKFGALVFLTVWIPHGLWALRGGQITRLAQQYAPQTNSAPTPVKGACTSVFLGYQLTDLQTGGDQAKQETFYSNHIADAKADLASIAKAGARYIRVGASGDQLLVPHPDQERVDDQFMAAVRATGLKTVFVDTQHPQICRKHKLDWNEFCKFQRDRISYYMKRYQPDVYYVVCEPMTYHQFALTKDTKFSAENWVVQLEQMCKLVKSIRPATRTGICLLVGPEKAPEWEVWTRMKNLPELDIVGVEIYVPENFAQTQDCLRLYGHPKASGKAFWIAETYNGWALANTRNWEQDAAWLKVASDFGRQVEAETLLVWTFNSFIPGGCFIDFHAGRLAQQWAADPRLSVVGQAFEKLP